MQYKALPWLRVCTFGLGAQSANIWRRDWNVRNAIIEVLVLRNPRTLSDPPGPPCPNTAVSHHINCGILVLVWKPGTRGETELEVLTAKGNRLLLHGNSTNAEVTSVRSRNDRFRVSPSL